MKGLRESCFELSHKGQFRMLTGGRVEGREGGNAEDVQAEGGV